MSATDVFNVAGSTISVAATESSLSATLPVPTAMNSFDVSVYNSGSNIAFVRWWNSSKGVQAALVTDAPIPPGAILNFYKGDADTFAAICLGGKTATVYFTPGVGN